MVCGDDNVKIKKTIVTIVIQNMGIGNVAVHWKHHSYYKYVHITTQPTQTGKTALCCKW